VDDSLLFRAGLRLFMYNVSSILRKWGEFEEAKIEKSEYERG